ncbi:MAG: septum formation initiator family protein [Rhodospirillaceae bacterium]
MGAAHEIKRRSRRMIVPILGTLFVCYFIAHTFQGDRGIIAWMHLQNEVGEAEGTLAETRAVRDLMEKRIGLLRSAHLDPDMLDERTRIMTGLVRPGEIVLIEPSRNTAR